MSTTITEATLTSFQRISYARLEPSGNLIVLAGKNASGKTSTLDGIQATLCGHNKRDIKRPILDGFGKATVDMVLSDGSTLIRNYTESGSTLKGHTASGEKFLQADIEKRLSSLGIDGRKFISLGEKEQLETLLSVVDLPFDPVELDQKRVKIYEDRTDVGRREKAIGDVVVDESLPTEETSASELISAIRESEALTRENALAKEEAQMAHEKVASLTEQIAVMQDQLEGWKHQVKVLDATLANATTPADTSELEDQLLRVEETNATIRANNTAIAQTKVKEGLSEEYAELTAQLSAIDQEKAAGLATAVMPVEGLSFDESGVLFNGVPFSRASGREQLIVSCAMIMATDPDIRVIVVRDGSVLDVEGMQLLQEITEDMDFQIFIEIVADNPGNHEYFFKEGTIE